MTNEILVKSESCKSMLGSVVEQLKANKNLCFAGAIKNYHWRAPEDGYWTETVDVIVAPLKPVFNVKKLNTLMDNLIDIKPTSRDSATDYFKDGIHFGRLYFDEKIGKLEKYTTNTITAINPIEEIVIQKAGREIGKTKNTREYDIKRRTWVRLYPEPKSAQIIYAYEKARSEGLIEYNDIFEYLEHWITGEQIRILKKKKNPFEQVSGYIEASKVADAS